MVTPTLEEEFRQVVEQRRAANTAFVNGDARPLKEMASHRDDVTILGAFGGFEHGWAEAGPRYDWAASRFNGGTFTAEIVATHVTPELAYSAALLDGSLDAVSPCTLVSRASVRRTRCVRLAFLPIALLGMPPLTEHPPPVDINEGDHEEDGNRRPGQLPNCFWNWGSA